MRTQPTLAMLVAGDCPSGDADAKTLSKALIDCGYLAADIETISAWSDAERQSARIWCRDGSLEALPAFMRLLLDNNDDASRASVTE